MADIVDRLIWMDTNTLDTDIADLCVEARNEIEQLRDEVKRLLISLTLAVGDLSTRDEYANVEPEVLMHGFLIRGMEEADRD